MLQNCMRQNQALRNRLDSQLVRQSRRALRTHVREAAKPTLLLYGANCTGFSASLAARSGTFAAVRGDKTFSCGSNCSGLNVSKNVLCLSGSVSEGMGFVRSNDPAIV